MNILENELILKYFGMACPHGPKYHTDGSRMGLARR